jgi:hypothetical protein
MLQAVRPDWENFRPLGDSLLWVVFLKIAEVAHIFGLLFPQLRLCINFAKNVLGYVLGDIFHKFIWSPWLQGTYVHSCVSNNVRVAIT